MQSKNCEGLSYPTLFCKSRGSVIRNNFLEYRTKQATLFARRNDFYALFATNKAKHILNTVNVLKLRTLKNNYFLRCS